MPSKSTTQHIGSYFDGFRSATDPSQIILSQEAPIHINFDKPDQCIEHNFCSHDYKLLEQPLQEEQVPLPLPIDKIQNPKTYLNQNFSHRQSSIKNRLIVDGKVRLQKLSDRVGVPISVPTQEGLEDWLAQSKSLGRQLREQKKPHKQNSVSQNQLLTQESVQQPLLDNFVPKIQERRVPELCFNPQTYPNQQKDEIIKHLQQSQQFSQTNANKKPSFNKSSKFKQTLSSTDLQQMIQPSQQMQPPSARSAISGQLNRNRRCREPNLKPWNDKIQGDTDSAILFLKTNHSRRFNEHTLARKLKPSEQLLQEVRQAPLSSQTDRNQEVEEDISQISRSQSPPLDEEEKKFFSMLPDHISTILKQAKKDYFQQREKILQKQKLTSNCQKLSVEIDLNQFKTSLDKHLSAMDSAISKNLDVQWEMPRTKLNEKLWLKLKIVQSDWDRVEQLLNDALYQAFSGLNPRFHMDRTEKQRLKTATGVRRTQNMRRMGQARRIFDFGEELGVQAYMKRNMIGCQSVKNRDLLREFQELTCHHPKLEPKQKTDSPTGSKRETPETRVSPTQSLRSLHNLSQKSVVLSEKVKNVVSEERSSRKVLVSATTNRGVETSRQMGNEKESKSQVEESNNTYLSSDYWFHKGVVLNQKSESEKDDQKKKSLNQSAVQCYRQALKINEKHLPSIFNLACNLEKLSEYEEAKHWFEHAIKVDPNWSDALYGLTLVCIRLDLAKEAIKHIQKANKVEGVNAKPYIKYALALAYRANQEWSKANEAYVPIMKDSNTIHTYRDMIDAKNKQLLEENIHGELGGVQLEVDLYSHFIQIGITESPHIYECDLSPYYDPSEGWNSDKLFTVVDLLRNMRFFNRFTETQIMYLLTKVTYKKITKRQVLFFEKNEACIIVSGKLRLLSHEEDLASPCLIATYHPGDIIGIDQLDNGWYHQKHSWLCAWENVDIFVCSSEYIKYLWDIQKKFSSNVIADMLDKTPYVRELSEQTIFTIAHDIAQVKEIQPEQIITYQDNTSMYNLVYLQQQHHAITEFYKDAKQKLPHSPTLKGKRQEQLIKQGFNKRYKNHKKEFAQRLSKLSELEREEQKDKIQVPKSQKFLDDIQRMHLLTNQEYIQFTQIKEVFNQNLEKLEQYKKTRDQLRAESEGFYIMIRGEAKLINQCEPKNIQYSLKQGDSFGLSKYFKSQGFTYFGDVIACAETQTAVPATCSGLKVKEEDSIQKKRTLSQTQKNMSLKLQKSVSRSEEESQGVTCLFIPEEKLYLIPFYDMRHLRESYTADKDMKKFRLKFCKDYMEKIRAWKKVVANTK